MTTTITTSMDDDHTQVTLGSLLNWRATSAPGNLGYEFIEDSSPAAVATWAALEGAAQSIGSRLAARVSAGDRVLLLSHSVQRFVQALFGCIYAGAVVVPAYEVSAERPKRTLERFFQMLQDATPAAILVDQASERVLNDFATNQTVAPILVIEDLLDGAADGFVPHQARPSDPVLIQFTSGSTVRPKGVVLSHRNILLNERLIARAHGHNESSTIVSWVPTAHDWGLINGILQPLYVGALGVLMTTSTFIRNPISWLEAISVHRNVTSGGPPFAFELCARHRLRSAEAVLDLSSWRCAGVAAEIVRPDVIERFARVFADCGFSSAAFYIGYGLAEATLLVSITKRGIAPRVLEVDRSALELCNVQIASSGSSPRRLLSCGETPPEIDLKIVDSNSRTECATNTVGEIWVSGDTIAQEYWQRPTDSELTLRARLMGSDRTYLRTSDLGFVHENELFVVGRSSDCICVRGRNVFPEDIEAALHLCHQALSPGGAAVFATSADDSPLELVVVHEAEPEPTQWRDAVQAIRLVTWRTCNISPGTILLVPRHTIPRTSSGKVRRNECRRLHLVNQLRPLFTYRATCN